MKRFLTILMIFAVSLAHATSYGEKRIARLIKPYEKAMDFITDLDPERQVNDHDVFVFFSKNDLYEKKDVKKFKSALRIVKRLTYTKKSLRENRQQLELLIDRLEIVQNFIVQYATTYYALITYYEIAANYYYIDEQHNAVVDVIIQQSDKLGLPDMQKNRGLYKFVKKIDLDLRRLVALFAQNIISDDLVVKMNQLKTKLIILKSKIVISFEYKSQLSKTRWLKAFGAIVVPFLIVLPISCFSLLFLQAPALEFFLECQAIGYFSVFIATSWFITCKELHESSKYNIPVYKSSVISLNA